MRPLPASALIIDTDSTFIYALVDPRDQVVKYIGRSYNVLGRYRKHLKSNKHLKSWVDELKATDTKPLLYEIEKTKNSNASERENYWISYYGLENLLNAATLPSLKNNKLEMYRDRKGISQAKLAKLVSVSQQTVYNIEHSEDTRSISIAIRIAKELDSTVEEIFS